LTTVIKKRRKKQAEHKDSGVGIIRYNRTEKVRKGKFGK